MCSISENLIRTTFLSIDFWETIMNNLVSQFLGQVRMERGGIVGRQPTIQRETLLERATDLVLVHGIIGITTDTLCKEIHMSKKTLYRFFSTKEALQHAIISWFFSHMGQYLISHTAKTKGQPADARFRDFLTHLTARLTRIDISKFRHLETQRPDLWDHIVSERERILSVIITEIVEDGRQDGTFRTDLTTEFITLSLISLITNIATPEHLVRWGMTPSACVESLSSLLLQGVVRRPLCND